jgi:hypothetical protein
MLHPPQQQRLQVAKSGRLRACRVPPPPPPPNRPPPKRVLEQANSSQVQHNVQELKQEVENGLDEARTAALQVRRDICAKEELDEEKDGLLEHLHVIRKRAEALVTKNRILSTKVQAQSKSLHFIAAERKQVTYERDQLVRALQVSENTADETIRQLQHQLSESKRTADETIQLLRQQLTESKRTADETIQQLHLDLSESKRAGEEIVQRLRIEVSETNRAAREKEMQRDDLLEYANTLASRLEEFTSSKRRTRS